MQECSLCRSRHVHSRGAVVTSEKATEKTKRGPYVSRARGFDERFIDTSGHSAP